MPIVNTNSPWSTGPLQMPIQAAPGGQWPGGYPSATDPSGITGGTDPGSLLGELGSLFGGIGALGGGIAQAGAQNNSASLAQQYAAMASQLGGFGLGMGPGGVNVTGNPMGAGGNIGLGGFNPAYAGLAGLAGGNVNTAAGIGAPNGLSPALQSAFGTASGGLAGINPGAIGGASNAALGAATGLAGGLSGGFGQQVTNQYNALQALQSPANINAANSLGNSLFGRGMLGSSSGGILGQQFGQGLAQQSSADAAAAAGLGIQALGTQANAATGLTWMGSNALNSAFNNFGNTSMLPANLQAGYLNPAMMGITGAGNLTNTGLGLYNAGLQSALGQNQAAARAGYLGTTNANSPNQQSPYGQLFGNLFGGLAQGANPAAGGNPLQQLFNGVRQLYNNYNQLNNLFGGSNPSSIGSFGSGGTGLNYGMDQFGVPTGFVNGGGYGLSGAGSSLGYGTDMFGVPTGFTGGGIGTGAGTDLSSMFSTQNILGSDASSVGSDLGSLFGPSAAGGEAATAPIGAGAGTGNMLLPSMLPSSYGSTAAVGSGAAAGGDLAGLGTAADTTGLSDIGAVGYGGADAAASGGGAAAAGGSGVAALGALGPIGLAAAFAMMPDTVSDPNLYPFLPGVSAHSDPNTAGVNALSANNPALYNQLFQNPNSASLRSQAQATMSPADYNTLLLALNGGGLPSPNYMGTGGGGNGPGGVNK